MLFAVLAAAACAPSGQPQSVTEFFGNPSPEEVAATEDALHGRHDQLTAECALRKGIQYSREHFHRPARLPAGGKVVLGRPNRAFKEQFGYGVSTHEIVDASPSSSAETISPELAGCMADAYAEVYEPLVHAEAELMPAYLRLRKRIDTEPRMVAAKAGWSACMATKGYDYRDPAEIEPYLLAKLRSMTGDSANGTEANISARRTLSIEEMAVSRADDLCSALQIESVENEVRADLEPEFVEQNHDLLRVLRGDPPALHENITVMHVGVSAAVIICAGVLVWRRRVSLSLPSLWRSPSRDG